MVKRQFTSKKIRAVELSLTNMVIDKKDVAEFK